MTRRISSLLDDWTLPQKNNVLQKSMQDTFIAPLAHNCTNSVITRDELCVVISTIPSSSFSFILSWLPSLSVPLYNRASIFRLLSLSPSSLFLSLVIF